MNKREEYLKQKVIECRAFTAACLKERLRFEQDRTNYNADDAPDSVRDAAIVSYQNYKLGLATTLFQSVEQLSFNYECKLSKYLGIRSNEPIVPFIDKYLGDVS